VVHAGLKGYFDSIPQDKLGQAMEKKIADGRILRLRQSIWRALLTALAGWAVAGPS
jgi:hypothetical protein